MMDGWILLKFRMGGALSRGIFHSKNGIELQMCENSVFLVPVKYTLVCHMPALAVLGRKALYRVS